MDELDLLKKHWKKDNDEYPKLSYNDIYKMILKKSSSIVKWIFIISVLEFAFWLLISFIFKGRGQRSEISEIESSTIFIILSVISYAVLFYFLYKFYKNYKTINSTDNATRLMENILKTRRTVKQYVVFNLATIVVSVLILLPVIITSDPNTKTMIEQATANGKVFQYYAGLFISIILVLGLFIGVLLLFYWLIYGILLKRLNKNYKELKKLEV